MARGVLVLAVLFSILSILFVTPNVFAKDSSTSVAKKKKVAKPSSASKRKSTTGAGTKKRHSVASRKAKASVRASKKSYQKTAHTAGKRKAADLSIPLAAKDRAAQPVLAAVNQAALKLSSHPAELKSNVALVFDQSNAEVLYAKNAKVALPIASITKLMTALVVVESQQDMNETLEVTREDIDRIKHTYSRLPIGSRLTRANMLHIALMSSENRAASALGRHYPGGLSAFVKAMNAKARELGMADTHYVEPTGLSSGNVSSARDLAKLVMVAHKHPIIRKYSTEPNYEVQTGGPVLHYRNSNRLTSNPNWEIGLQKTGYIAEAGRCLVMQAIIKGRSIIMVFLDSEGKYSRLGDAGRVRTWLEKIKKPEILSASLAVQG